MAECAVVGAGPVGQVVAGTIAASGRSVALCEINDATRRRIAEEGISVRGARELTVAPEPNLELFGSVDDLAGRDLDLVIVCVKAAANPLVGSALADVIGGEALVVSWQNGIDTELPLAETLGRGRVARAVVNYGVSTSEHGVVLSFEHAPHYLRELDPAGRARVESVAQRLSQAGLITERSENLTAMVWKKAILNASLNALCGLTGLDMAAATRDSSAWHLAEQILIESMQVARANEIWLGTDFYDSALRYLRGAGAHRPSMLVDLEAGRRTEIDYINARIVEYGRIGRVATPFNQAMVSLVKAREASA